MNKTMWIILGITIAIGVVALFLPVNDSGTSYPGDLVIDGLAADTLLVGDGANTSTIAQSGSDMTVTVNATNGDIDLIPNGTGNVDVTGEITSSDGADFTGTTDVDVLSLATGIIPTATGKYLKTPNVDAGYFYYTVRDDDAGPAVYEIARMQNGNVPYFSLGTSQENKFYPDGTVDISGAMTTSQPITIINQATPSTVADGCSFFATDNKIADSSEMWVIDEAGNTTQLSSHYQPDGMPDHDPKMPTHTLSSYNIYTGEKITYDLHALALAVELLTGETIIYEENVSTRDWDADQADFAATRIAEIAEAQAKIDSIDALLLDGEITEEECIELKSNVVIPEPYVKKVNPYITEMVVK